MHIADFLDKTAKPSETWATGLNSLDSVVGGLTRGQLWVITGAPASGKSMMLMQLLFAAAVEHDFRTDYYCSRVDHADLTRARLLSLALGRPADLSALSMPLNDLQPGQQARLDTLINAPLNVFTGGGFTIPQWQDASSVKRCLAIDDPEFKRPPVLDPDTRHELRQLADSGTVVMVTVPLSLCVETTPLGQRLREEWSAVADVVIETTSGVAGDGVLSILQNRRGPRLDLRVVALAHQARFIDYEPP